MTQDVEHPRLLAIFHHGVSGIACLISFFPAIHLTVGILTVSGAFDEPKEQLPLEIMGRLFIASASLLILGGLTFSVCLFPAGRYLHKRRHYTYCLVMAALECMFMPFGTILGVFTLLVSVKSGVKELFADASAAGPAGIGTDTGARECPLSANRRFGFRGNDKRADAEVRPSDFRLIFCLKLET